jgi:hypothetical protein
MAVSQPERSLASEALYENYLEQAVLSFGKGRGESNVGCVHFQPCGPFSLSPVSVVIFVMAGPP